MSNLITNGITATSTDTLSNKTFIAPVLGTPASGTATNITGLPLTSGVTGTLAPANGGTGQSSLAALLANLSVFTSGANGLAPASGGGTTNFLRADGTWASPPGGGGGSVTSVAVSGGTTGLTTSGGPITTSGTITLAGTLGVGNGGTGVTTLAALAADLPLFTSGAQGLTPASGGGTTNFLRADGTWAAPAGGTVTSVAVSGGTTGLTTSGGPITTSGTITLTGTLAVANGGTGVSTSTGTGSVVLSNSPTLVSPALGTPASGVATNLTGLPLTSGVTGTLGIANGGTGVTTATGTGSLVLSNSPTLVTPALGTPASGVATNLTGLPLTTGVTGTLGIGNGGTGQTTAQAALNALAGTQTNNRVLRSDGTNTTLSQVGLTTDVTGTLPVGNGGTGQTTLAALTANLSVFTSVAQGVVPASGGGTTNFLRADGTWTTAGASSQWTTAGSDIYYNTGNVGIGTATPTQPLEIVTSGNNGLRVVGSTGNQFATFEAVNDANHYFFATVSGTTFSAAYLDSNQALLYTDAPGGLRFTTESTVPMRFDTNSTERMRLDGNGKLGIGTISPGQLLDVAGKFQVDSNGDPVKIKNITYSWPSAQGSASDVLTNDGAGNLSWAPGGGGGSQWTTSGSDIYYNTGNVGIGTTTPIHKLQINNGAAPGAGVTTWAGMIISGVGINNALSLVDDTHALYYHSDAGSNSAEISTYDYGASAGFSLFFNNNGGPIGFGPGTATSQATINGNASIGTGYNSTAAPTNGLIVQGNVGIGTSSPATKFHVYNGSAPGNLGPLTGSAILTTGAGTQNAITMNDGDNNLYFYLDSSNNYGSVSTYNYATSSTLPFLINANGGNVSAGPVPNLTPSNTMTVSGNASIGAGYFNNSAPTNGLIVQGNVGIGTTSPGQLLDVANKFQVDSNGNILKINNIATSFPASQGAANSILTNDGSGDLTWSSGLIGITSGSAIASGIVGETIESIVDQGSSVAVTSGTPLNITQITLPAGSWNISFGINALQSGGGTLTTTDIVMGLSTTSATLPGNSSFGDTLFASPVGPNTVGNLTITAPLYKRDLSGNQTYYLVFQAGFSGSSMNVNGKIVATRKG